MQLRQFQMQIYYLALRLFYFLRVQYTVTGICIYRNRTGGIVWMSVSEQHVVTELAGTIDYGSDLYSRSAGVESRQRS